jgi:uncharacterized protein YbjQ (UPF0145 family)
VPLFGRQKPVPPTEEELRAAEVDLERIRQGGIPLGAEQRLKRIASASTPFFTSDLSAKEYALAQAGGLQPLAQVMGSSVVQHGWYGQQGGGYYWTTGEVPGLSEPWNLARNRAFDRLRQEATLAGGDSVIGIEIAGGSLAGPGNVELVVFGTAVRDNAFDSHGELGMCTLSGQEVDKLRRIGAQVCGVVGHTSVIAVQLAPASAWAMNSGGAFGGGVGRMNVEIPEISEGVYEARRRAMSEVRRQANAAQANNIVISTLRHSIEHREYEQVGYTHHYFYVTMNILGTAIRLGAREPYPQPLPGPMMSINLGAR